MVEDISERKLAEEVQRATEERFRTLTELSPDGIMINAGGRFTYANPAALRLLGASHPDQVLGRPALDFILPEYQEQTRSRIAWVLQEHLAPLIEVGFRRVDGSPIMVEATAGPVHWDGTTAVQVLLRDVSERRQAEEARRASEARLRTVLEAIPIGAVLAHADRRIIEANKAYLDLIGQTKEDLLSGRVRWDEITPPEWLAADEQAIAEARARGVATMYEKEYLRHGERIPVLVGVAAINGGDTLAAFAFDLRARKATEAALQARTTEWEALIETAPVAVWFSYDPDLREVKANRLASELLEIPLSFDISDWSAQRLPPRRLFRNGAEVPPDQRLSAARSKARMSAMRNGRCASTAGAVFHSCTTLRRCGIGQVPSLELSRPQWTSPHANARRRPCTSARGGCSRSLTRCRKP